MQHALRELEIQANFVQRMLDTRKARIAEKQARLAAIQTEMAVDEAVIAQLEEELAALSPGGMATEANGTASAETSVGSLPTGNLAEKIVNVLREAKQPMRGWEIAARLKELGVESESPKGLLPSVFAVFKRRKDLFTKVERGLYRLKESEGEKGG